MAIYDRQWCREVRAILDKASVLKVEPKQSIEPVKVEIAVSDLRLAISAPTDKFRDALQDIAQRVKSAWSPWEWSEEQMRWKSYNAPLDMWRFTIYADRPK